MAAVAFVFPGQGAQTVGMGKDFYERFEPSRAVYERASQILDFDIIKACFDGPDEYLAATEISQPALLVTSIAVLRALETVKSDLVASAQVAAGLSLGEYTALVFARSLEFDDAVRLVAERGRLMSEAGKKTPGAMVSIVGPEPGAVRQIAERVASTGPCSIANLNCPGQVVISGGVDAVTEAAAIAEKELGARTVRLNVSGAFHSPLMTDAQNGLREFIKDVDIRPPAVKFVSNVSADYEDDPERIRALLVDQVASPVLWQASMEKIISDGVGAFYEIGPGRVLRGLLRKIDRKADVKCLNSADSIGGQQIDA